MHRIILSVVVLGLISSCGLLADTVSDQISLDIETDAIKESSIAEGNVPSIGVDFALDASNPSYTLAGQETEAWMPVLMAERARREAGGTCTLTDCDTDFGMTMSSFTVTGDYYVNFNVRIFSRDREDGSPGLVIGMNADQTPKAIDACSFSVDTGADYAANLTKCLSDWVAENGVPVELDMEVTSSQGSARQADDYEVDGRWDMDAFEYISAGASTEMFKLNKDVVNNKSLVNCDDVKFRGEGYTDSHLDVITGGVNIYDAEKGEWVGNATMVPTSMSPGNYYLRVDGDFAGLDPVVVANGVVIVVFPGGVNAFFEAVLEAADTAGSYGSAWWLVAGDYPRSGWIKAHLEGPCDLSEE